MGLFDKSEEYIQSKKFEQYDKALLYADKVLPILPSFASFNVSQIVMFKSDWLQEEKEEANDVYHKIHSILVTLNYAIDVDGYHVKLTDKGRDAKKLGGHYLYEEKEKEKQSLQDRKAIIDLKNAERISKTYWYSFVLAVAAFLISLYLLILKIKGL